MDMQEEKRLGEGAAGGGVLLQAGCKMGRASGVKERMGPKWRSIGGKRRSEVEAMGRERCKRNVSGERETTRE
ncbi:uncharacterized protein SPSK_03816 [Sporothrix schenckii 1099-18]|uniref:Uncharacterized protein n=1 Tax=Sporothrix schenckii 1099-18 TaxID=1397361 RepID=A0A0F2M0I5_SPOSC|nr:uncharacterized protein SPSK_03816 [Sporothrix schenckii 1099-18]KJR82584.1 hypothetical protein SPSK_03816 [Sporothrix schenckii 1099-18]